MCVQTNDEHVATNVQQGEMNEPRVRTNGEHVATNVQQVEMNEPRVRTNGEHVATNVQQVEMNEPRVRTNDEHVATNDRAKPNPHLRDLSETNVVLPCPRVRNEAGRSRSLADPMWASRRCSMQPWNNR